MFSLTVKTMQMTLNVQTAEDRLAYSKMANRSKGKLAKKFRTSRS